jgi:hypothetical protein
MPKRRSIVPFSAPSSLQMSGMQSQNGNCWPRGDLVLLPSPGHRVRWVPAAVQAGGGYRDDPRPLPPPPLQEKEPGSLLCAGPNALRKSHPLRRNRGPSPAVARSSHAIVPPSRL